MTPLINKYRPETWEEVVGHTAIVEALQRSLTTDSHPHSFFLSGPGGLGKTTLARIIARELGAEIVEIDAATFSGIDNMREVVSLGAHGSFEGEGVRFILIDEVHGLSKPAFQALLKVLEEPPDHLYFALCTTEPAKVPETIRMRCYQIALRPLDPGDIRDLIEAVAELEGWAVSEDVLTAVVQAATGQPRKALSILQAVQGAKDRDEVKRIIALQDDSDDLSALIKLVVSTPNRATWKNVSLLLAKVPDDAWEGGLIQFGRYLMGAMMQTDNGDMAKTYWKALEALTFPSQTFDNKARFYAALGRILWGD